MNTLLRLICITAPWSFESGPLIGRNNGGALIIARVKWFKVIGSSPAGAPSIGHFYLREAVDRQIDRPHTTKIQVVENVTNKFSVFLLVLVWVFLVLIGRERQRAFGSTFVFCIASSHDKSTEKKQHQHPPCYWPIITNNVIFRMKRMISTPRDDADVKLTTPAAAVAAPSATAPAAAAAAAAAAATATAAVVRGRIPFEYIWGGGEMQLYVISLQLFIDVTNCDSKIHRRGREMKPTDVKRVGVCVCQSSRRICRWLEMICEAAARAVSGRSFPRGKRGQGWWGGRGGRRERERWSPFKSKALFDNEIGTWVSRWGSLGYKQPSWSIRSRLNKIMTQSSWILRCDPLSQWKLIGNAGRAAPNAAPVSLPTRRGISCNFESNHLANLIHLCTRWFEISTDNCREREREKERKNWKKYLLLCLFVFADETYFIIIIQLMATSTA